MLKLEQLRRKHKYSQNDVALLLGTTNQTISNWEKGKTEPDIEYLKKISDLFHVSIDYLVEHNVVEKNLSDLKAKIFSMNREELLELISDIIFRLEK